MGALRAGCRLGERFGVGHALRHQPGHYLRVQDCAAGRDVALCLGELGIAENAILQEVPDAATLPASSSRAYS
jgi:hypothetical protein